MQSMEGGRERKGEGGGEGERARGNLQPCSKETKHSHTDPNKSTILVVKSGDHILGAARTAHLHGHIPKMNGTDHNPL